MSVGPRDEQKTVISSRGEVIKECKSANAPGLLQAQGGGWATAGTAPPVLWASCFVVTKQRGDAELLSLQVGKGEN